MCFFYIPIPRSLPLEINKYLFCNLRQKPWPGISLIPLSLINFVFRSKNLTKNNATLDGEAGDNF